MEAMAVAGVALKGVSGWEWSQGRREKGEKIKLKEIRARTVRMLLDLGHLAIDWRRHTGRNI